MIELDINKMNREQYDHHNGHKVEYETGTFIG